MSHTVLGAPDIAVNRINSLLKFTFYGKREIRNKPINI